MVRVGVRVEAAGLTNAKELNGLRARPSGSLIRFDREVYKPGS